MRSFFLIPTKDQWNRWSLPSRVGWVSYALTVVSLFLAVIAPFIPSDTDTIIRKTNPTTLRLSDAGLVHWQGDQEPFLTVTVRNVSKLDALNPFACMVKESTCEEKVRSNGIITAPGNINISIPPDETMQLPIAAESEVLKLIEDRASRPFKVLGWGLSPQLPENLPHSCQLPMATEQPCAIHLLTLGIPVRTEWQSVLDEHMQTTSAIYAYVELL